MRGKRIQWSDAEKSQAVAAYCYGMKSTRDLAADFAVSFQSIATMLKSMGVRLSAGRHIARKMTGRPSHRKGAKQSPGTIEKMRLASMGRQNTLGKRYTLDERANISAGLATHYAKLRAEGKLLSAEEKRARASCRNRYKQLVRRLIDNKAGRRVHELLGYSSEEFRRHIEAQFQPGMSWADRESFHVDHKEPVSAFVRRGVTDPKVVCALSNLQPLTPHQNRKKSSSVGT